MDQRTHQNSPENQILLKSISCLSMINVRASSIVETNASDIGYGEILKQSLDKKESIVRIHSEWNSTQELFNSKERNTFNSTL